MDGATLSKEEACMVMQRCCYGGANLWDSWQKMTEYMYKGPDSRSQCSRQWREISEVAGKRRFLIKADDPPAWTQWRGDEEWNWQADSQWNWESCNAGAPEVQGKSWKARFPARNAGRCDTTAEVCRYLRWSWSSCCNGRGDTNQLNMAER